MCPARRHACDFLENWYPRQVTRVQYGLGERGPRSRISGEPVCGGAMSDDELAANRADIKALIAGHPLSMPPTRAVSPMRQMTVPVLSAGNWGGNCLHLRGNLTASPTRSRRRNGWKWRHAFLVVLCELWTGAPEAVLRPFPQGRGQWLAERPRVMINIRRPGERFTLRYENE